LPRIFSIFWAIGCLVMIMFTGSAFAAKSIVVFPFDNETKNPTLDWIGDSIVETLNEQLVSPYLSTISLDQRNAAYDRLGLPYDGAFSRATLMRVGQELDANYAVVGAFSYDQAVFSATTQLIDLEKFHIEAEFTEKGPLDSLMKVQSRIAWRLLTHFDSMFPYSQDDFFKRFETIPLSAFENYVRGRRALDSKSQLQYFLKAERLFPSYSKAIFQIGKAYFQQKDYTTSQLWLHRITKTDRRFGEATFYLGLDYYFMNNFERAASAFTLLSIEVPLNEVFNNLAAALSRMGRSNQVVHNYQMAIDGDPGEEDFYFNLGYYFWKNGDFASAAKNLRDALQLNPEDAEASYLLAHAMQSLKQTDESAHYLKLASQLNPKTAAWSPSSLPPLERIKLNYDAEFFLELKSTLDRLFEEKTKTRSVTDQSMDHFKRGSELFHDHMDAEALNEFNQALALDSGLTEAHIYLGRIYERREKFDQAIRELKNALEKTRSAEAHALLAHLYFTLERRREAEQEVAAALEIDPANQAAIEMKALLRQNVSALEKRPAAFTAHRGGNHERSLLLV
jgi:tetratricopeptide (TPR) repeat protein